MCIRDRAHRLQGPPVRRRGAAQRIRHAEPPAHADDRSESCLLYTSDAADERSSVDLGGRRIIKKKTHRHPER